MSRDNYDKKGPDIEKYLHIALIVLILLVGLNRFVFARSFSLSIFGNNDLSQKALEYYMENYGEEIGDEEVEAKVQNFGCHKEIYIFKDNQLVMKLSFANGQMYEIE